MCMHVGGSVRHALVVLIFRLGLRQKRLPRSILNPSGLAADPYYAVSQHDEIRTPQHGRTCEVRMLKMCRRNGVRAIGKEE